MDYQHIPVLLQPVLEYLQPRPNQNFIDATLGGGGYTTALRKKIMPHGKVLAIDLDKDAVENYTAQVTGKSYQGNVVAVRGNFARLTHIVHNHGFTDISGIVADIGLSSYQLDQSGRGISFQKDEPLDMRFDLSANSEPDARFLLNNYAGNELAKIFRDYGEENLAGQIAREVVRRRTEGKLFHTTFDLVEAIKAALPKPVKHRWADSTRRVFQALRIAVNHELENLESFLPQALDLLNPGGRLVIVSFHSLEDRIVKQFFAKAGRGCICPLDFPVCVCGKNPAGKVLTKKPVTASAEEQGLNPRSKPAKLRALLKT
jgi:16S rRNA (cytosine1402-N4)-methyltransferase